MDSLGDRMKKYYEDRGRIYLTRRIPVIMRLDGRAFHTVTKSVGKPFDDDFMKAMGEVTLVLMKEIQGAKCGYVQSDEASILITDYDKLKTEAWFDYNIQKMVSVAASIMSIEFNVRWGGSYRTQFDCRVWNHPREDVENYFLWRQKDWERNSLNMLARSVYSHKQLHKKEKAEIHEMLHNKGLNWVDLDNIYREGTFISFDPNYHIFEKVGVTDGTISRDLCIWEKCPRFNDERARQFIRGLLCEAE